MLTPRPPRHNTPDRRHIRSQCPIVASDPPFTTNVQLDSALHVVRHSGCPAERGAAWKKAVRICIQEKNGECLEWLSRHHATAEGCALQPDAKLQLTGKLSSEDLRYVREWSKNRVHQAPIELGFRFINRPLTNDDVEQIAALFASATVKVLTLFGCGLTDESLCTLAAALHGNRCIESLNLGENPRVKLVGMAALAHALDGNISLKRLGLDLHRSKGGLALLCEALKTNQCLNELSLRAAGGSSKDAKALGRLMEKAGALKNLNLMFAEFSPPGEFALHALGNRETTAHKLKRKILVLKPTKRIKTYSFDIYLKPIYTALAKCRSLEKLDMHVHGLDMSCAKALSELLGFGCITSLYVGWKEKETEAADILGAALSVNHSLLHFQCGDKQLGRTGRIAARNNLKAQALHHAALGEQAPTALQRLLDPNVTGLPPLPLDVLGVITELLPPQAKKHLVDAAPGHDAKQ